MGCCVDLFKYVVRHDNSFFPSNPFSIGWVNYALDLMIVLNFFHLLSQTMLIKIKPLRDFYLWVKALRSYI